MRRSAGPGPEGCWMGKIKGGRGDRPARRTLGLNGGGRETLREGEITVWREEREFITPTGLAGSRTDLSR